MFRNLLYLKICGKDFVSDLSLDEKDELASLVKDESTGNRGASFQHND